MPLRLHNTLSGRVEDFTPARPGPVALYVCGPTVYAPAHIGHGRSYIVFDVLRRTLEHRGLAVDHVQNITDVSEEISLRARQAGEDASTTAERYIADFRVEMERLHVKPAREYPRVSRWIDPIVATIRRLLDGGRAYVADGSVYLDAQKAGGFGALSHQRLEDMLADGVSPSESPRRHPLDFALWKPAKEWETAWDAPWGRGRPGWHIECAVMSGALLPRPLDIHGGGIDLIYPHHESEMLIARAETGDDLSRFYVHNALVTHRLQKMSKSRANYVTLAEVFEEYEPDPVRFALLSHHYRKPMECCDEGFDDAVRTLDALEAAARALREALPGDEEAAGAAPAPPARSPRRAFEDALDADLDTPAAIAALTVAAREARRSGPARSAARREAALLFRDAAAVLGLPSLDPTGVEAAAG